jgi:RNA-directed DNA polymerase
MMHEHEKSDAAIGAEKLANKVERSAAQPVEQRAAAKGNADQQSTRRAQDRESVSQALERVRQAARQTRKEKFTALFHHLSAAMLRTAFFALKKDAAPGVDGLTSEAYEADLDRRIGCTGEHIGRSHRAGGLFRKQMAANARGCVKTH